MEFNDFIYNIVQGIEIEKGSKVVLNFWGENKDLSILDKFSIEVAKLGALPIRLQQSREFINEYFKEVPAHYLKFDDETLSNVKNAQVVIDIFTYGIQPHKDFPKEKIDLYKKYIRNLFEALSYEKETYVQVRVPTEENAMEEGVNYEVYKKSMYKALSVDNKKLKESCTRVVKALENKEKVTIHTKNNNILELSLGDRIWNKDDGRGDIPCGEVYIAPIEKSANGKIVIPEVILEDEILKDVLLEFKDGRIIKCSEKTLMEFIKHFPGDSDVIAEFGIGLNDKVKELSGCSVIDEKCKGTAHIAIGMNNMFGGVNSSPLHMDFIFTPVKVECDKDVIMDKGKLLI